MTRHIHIDCVGGLSGDMFLAAMLSALPQASETVQVDLDAAGLQNHISITPCAVKKSGFAATQIKVEQHPAAPPTHHWRDIRAFLFESSLRDPVKERAINIFEHLAQAEAVCHGVPIEKVHFHEIADWDSIADIVSAASVIVQCGAVSWSVGTLPLGQGRAQTQHGLIAVPAPATVELLRGFAFHDDGGEGERITPTGAAILRHLSPVQNGPPPGAVLMNSGTGAGQRDIVGIPNICRLLIFDLAQGGQDYVTEISFEIDDMTPEELSLSLDRIRDHTGVLDAGYSVGVGKKGRARFEVSVLSKPETDQSVIDLCLTETSTLGLRIGTVKRRILARKSGTRAGLRFKQAARPSGATTKVESDDLRSVATLKSRREAARNAETEHD